MSRSVSFTVQREISQNVTEAAVLIELAAGSPIGTLYLAHRELYWGGRAYQNRVVSHSAISGGTINIGEQIPSQKSFTFTLEDTAGTLISQAISVYINKTVTVREVIIGTGETVTHAFVVRKITSSKAGEITFSCVDIYSVQQYPDIPRLYIDTDPFPKVDSSLLGVPVPVIHGTKKVPLLLVDKGDPDTLAPARFLIGAGTYTVSSAWELEYALPTSAYSVTTSTSGFTHTILEITNPENIYGPGGRVDEFFATVTRTDAPSPYGGASNTPTNVFYDYWTNTEYGLGNSSADLDATYFVTATSALEYSHDVPIRFNCRVSDSISFSELFSNLLFSSHSWVSIEDKVRFHHFDTSVNTSGFDESNILKDNPNDVGIQINSRDITRIFNDFYLAYENSSAWSQSISETRGPQIDTQHHTITTGDGGTDNIGVQSQGVVNSYFLGDAGVASIVGKLHIIELANALTEVSFKVDMTGRSVEVLDRVPVSWDLFGWDGQYVRITNIETNPNYYTLKGYTTVVEGATTASVIALGENFKPAPVNVSGLTLTSVFGTMLAKWTGVGDLSVPRYHVQVAYAAASADLDFSTPFANLYHVGTSFPFGATTDYWYQVRVKAVDVFNQESNTWTSSNVEQAKAVSASDIGIDWIKQTYIDFTGIATPYIIANSAAILGTLVVGSPLVAGSAATIQSYNYSSGTSGWSVNYDGSAEFNDIIFRGSLEGATGTFSGIIDVSGAAGRVVINPASTYYLTAIYDDDQDEIVRVGNNSVGMTVGQPTSGVNPAYAKPSFGITAYGRTDGATGVGSWSGVVGYGDRFGGKFRSNYLDTLSSSDPYTIPYGIYVDAYGGYGARIIQRNGANLKAVLGLSKETGTASAADIRFDAGTGAGITTTNPNGSLTGKFGDVLMWNDLSGGDNRARLSICQGNDTGPGSYGTSWKKIGFA